jgi:hypothetical protein
MDNIIREAIVALVVTKRESDLDGATIVTITRHHYQGTRSMYVKLN